MKAFGQALPILLLLVLGLRLECIMIDALHGLDLGFSAHIIGNTMWEGIRRHVWGPTNNEDNVDVLQKDMVQYCKDNKVESRVQGQLSKDRIRSTNAGSGYPKLKAKGGTNSPFGPVFAGTRQAVPKDSGTFCNT